MAKQYQKLRTAFNEKTVKSTGQRVWTCRKLAARVRKDTGRRCCTSTAWKVVNGYIVRGPRYRAICEILGVDA